MTAEERTKWIKEFAPPFNYALFNNPLECYAHFKHKTNGNIITIRDFNPKLDLWENLDYDLVKQSYNFPSKCNICNIIFNIHKFCNCNPKLNKIVIDYIPNYKLNKHGLELVEMVKNVRMKKLSKIKIPIQNLLKY